MSRPQQTVQATHAAIEATKHWPYSKHHPHLVVVGIKTEEKLKNALRYVQEQGILVAPFYEESEELTAFATRPIVQDRERQLLRKFQLLK